MNGRDTSAAAAVFLALMSIGLLLKLDDVIISCAGSAVCAMLSALMTKKALMQTSSEFEDVYQRLEAQIHQLRSRMGGDQIEQLERQTRLLDGISNKINNFEGFERPEQSNDDLKAAIEQLIEAQKALPTELEKISARLEEQIEQSKANAEAITEKLSGTGEKFEELADQSAKLAEKLDSLNSVVTTGVKLVQVMGQLMKAPPVAKDITHLAETVDGVSEKLMAVEKLEQLEQIHSTMIENGKSVDEVMNGVRENMMGMTFQFDKSLTEFGELIKGLTAEVEKLVERIDAYNGLTKATLEQYSMLTEQDVRILEDLTRKLEVRS